MTEHVENRTYPHDVDNRARIYADAQDRLWVTHEELLLCGYRNISDFDIVYLNGKFYELQAHIRKADAWWVEEVEAQELPEPEPASVSASFGSPEGKMRNLPEATGGQP